MLPLSDMRPLRYYLEVKHKKRKKEKGINLLILYYYQLLSMLENGKHSCFNATAFTNLCETKSTQIVSTGRS
jgi:hypothetical protein